MITTPRSREDIKRLEFDDELEMFMRNMEGQARVRSYFRDLRNENSMISLLESVLCLPGDVIECGVFRGMSLRQIGMTLSEKARDKQLFGLDSFEGFPQDKVRWRDMGFMRFPSLVRKKFKMCNDTPARLENFFDCFGIKGTTVKGFFQDTLPQFKNHKFCFIHLDCDIYESYRECLNGLYDCLVPGGIVVFDDYRSTKWPGAERAVNEFFVSRDEKVECCSDRKRASWFVRKTDAENLRSAA